ncbi:MAG: two-component regulator propeller domain-containing protein, partial [Bacteroidota bacterium]
MNTIGKMMIRYRRIASLLACLVLLSQSLPAQYILNQWTTTKGLPQNSVNAIAQDREGYLILGTFSGLVKFDGVKFAHIDVIDNKMLSNRILSLLFDDQQTLWIGSEGGGLARFRNDSIRNFTGADGLDDEVITALCADRSGRVWIGTRNGIQSIFHDSIRHEPLQAPQDHRWVYSLFKDSQGILWANIGGGVYRKAENGNFEKVVFRTQNRFGAHVFLCEDHEKRLWFRDGQNIGAATDHSVSQTKYSMSFRIKREYERMIEDSLHCFWLGSIDGGLFDGGREFSKSQFTSYALPNGKNGFHIRCAFIDGEGNRWFGTEGNGLIQIKEKKISIISTDQGLSNEIIEPVMEDTKGNIWVGTNCGGLNKIFPDGKISWIPLRRQAPPVCVWSLAEDRQGGIWVGTYGDGLYYLKGNDIKVFNDRNGLTNNIILALKADRTGNLWIGTNGGGLDVYRKGTFTSYTHKDGLVNDNISYIYEDHDSSLWIGTLGGLSHFVKGRFTNYTIADGLTNNYVRSIYRDSDGILWIGTYGGGLLSYSEGIFKAITTKNGLFDNVVSAIVDDGKGCFWMTCNRGIYCVNRRMLVDYINDRISEIYCTAYGIEEGLLSDETNGGFQPAAWKTKDDRILFPTVKGLAILPLASASITDAHVPPVHIERVIVNQKEYSTGPKIIIPYGNQHIEIQYTALSFSDYQHMVFKFRLEGLQNDWVVAGQRRSAFYSGLPPGDYRFQVIAANNGLWNETGAMVDMTVPPPWWGTWKFRGSVFFIVVLSGFLLYYQRKRIRLQKELEHLEFSRKLIDSVEQERRIISSELHDSIGQELLIIKNRALLALQEPKKKNILEQMEEISSAASHAIDQTREISYNLRPYQIDQLGLKKALESITTRIAKVSSTKFDVHIDEINEVVPKEWQIHLYRIVQECVGNVSKHAKANECRMSVLFKKPYIVIEVFDDGPGFMTAKRRKKSQERRGIEFQSMAEHIRILGGTFELHSLPG